MSGISLEGFAYSGRLQDLNDSSYNHLEKRFATIVPTTSNRAALDVLSIGFHLVGAADRVVEALSDDKQIVLTGHDIKKGDFIRLKVTANPIEEVEIAVRRVIDVNTVELDGVLSDTLTAGDTFDILRGIPQRFDDTGASLASVVSPPIQFLLDGANQTVTEDTVTPANNAPLPVKLTSVTGDINITANDLNVQLSHTGATPDSTQIGDGTEILLISTAGEALTLPGGNVADNAADAGNPIKMGGVYTLATPTLDDGDRGNLRLDVNGRLLVSDITVGGSVGTFAQDSAFTAADTGYHMLTRRQDTLAATTSADGDYDSLKSNSVGSLYVVDAAVETQLTTLNAKVTAFDLDGSGGTENVQGSNLRISQAGGPSIEAKGQQNMANSIPVALSSDQSSIPITAAALPLPSGAATEVTLAALAAEDFATQTTLALVATEATLAAQSAKLPASLGAKTSAASLSVVLASDATTPPAGGRSVVDFARLDYSSTSVTTGAFVELDAAVALEANAIEIFDSSGQTLELAFGAASSEVVQLRIFPGGNGLIPLNVPAATRISLRAVSATADAGEINVNFYS